MLVLINLPQQNRMDRVSYSEDERTIIAETTLEIKQNGLQVVYLGITLDKILSMIVVMHYSLIMMEWYRTKFTGNV